MAYWLFKSDPETYGYDDLEKEKKAVWDGVKNPVALRNLKACKNGDQVFIYHTGEEKSIIGIAEVVGEAYPDPKSKDPKLVVVDIKASRRVKKPVTLSDVKQRKEFADFALTRLPRLSVMPVTEAQWKSLMKMAGE